MLRHVFAYIEHYLLVVVDKITYIVYYYVNQG